MRRHHTRTTNNQSSPAVEFPDLVAEDLQTETLLRQSGIPFTILRNGWHTENYMGSVGSAFAAGAFIGSAGDGKISGAARTDVAASQGALFDGSRQLSKLIGRPTTSLADCMKKALG